MLAVIELVLPLFSLIFIGYISARLAKLSLEGLAWINFFIVYVALPAMFFQLLSKTPVEQFSNASFITITTLSTLVIFILCFAIAALRNGWNVPESTIQGFAGAYGNIGYMGPPLALAAFGLPAGVPVALVFCFDNTMHFILAPLLMSLSDKQKISRRKLVMQILTKIFTHPFIVATIFGVGFALLELRVPSVVDKTLAILAAAAAPCALFVMGLTAALRPLKRVPIELSYLTPIKLVLHPLIVYFALVTLMPDLDPIWLHSAVLMAALPSATNVFVIAQQYNVWQERASSSVIVSTLFAMGTLTTLLYLLA